MARILIITHTYDDYLEHGYLLGTISEFWQRAGHSVRVAAGPERLPDADVAILHVDLSVVPAEYVEAARRYPVLINGRATDIRKRSISRFLLQPDDAWGGPVIVKTDLNNSGLSEWRLENIAERRRAPGFRLQRYPVLGSLKDVPEQVWRDPSLVVERFMPEQDVRGYWIRTWTFFGEGERCTRYLGSHPVIKGADVMASEPAAVPDELRQQRLELGFDYGKFDFVMHDGKACLFDANCTPGPLSRKMRLALAESNRRLASGLDTLLKAQG